MIIDVHGHITSPALFERFPMPRGLLDIDGMIEKKAALGISLTIVGSPVGAGTMVRVPGLDNYRQPADQLKSFHEWLAEQVRARPGGLKAYAYANPLGGDAMLAATAALLAQDEFAGIIANSSVAGEYLDSPQADGFFAMAAAHQAPVLLHPPAEPAGSTRLRDPRLVEHVARPCDVTVGLAAVVFAGWLEKYPDLVLIAPMAGGGLPVLFEKLELAAQMPRRLGPVAPADGGPFLAGPLGASLARVYVDTATPSTAALAAALRVLGPGRMLFGSDSPPLAEPLGRAVDRIAALALAPAGHALVSSGNARRIFGLQDPQTAAIAGRREGREKEPP